MRDHRLVVDDVPDPRPGPGQLLVRTRACGICGSDLHALEHGDRMVAMSEQGAGFGEEGMPAPVVMDLGRDVVMGHEFAAEVVELGENVGNSAVEDLVVSMPVALDTAGLHPIGYSNHYPGGYGELMILSDLLAIRVPNGLDAAAAALTEPMAVGLHAVNRSSIRPGESAIVLGCGPIGLAVIGSLRRAGIEPIVAADYSAIRRGLAADMGADVTVDPAEDSVFDAWRRTREGPGDAVVFEAVGTPGMLESAMLGAPRGARIVVVGVCMEPDRIEPLVGITKELSLTFVFGYDPVEFQTTLHAIADGELPVEGLVTGRVPLDGVAGAFEELRDPEAHAKILVVPN